MAAAIGNGNIPSPEDEKKILRKGVELLEEISREISEGEAKVARRILSRLNKDAAISGKHADGEPADDVTVYFVSEILFYVFFIEIIHEN